MRLEAKEMNETFNERYIDILEEAEYNQGPVDHVMREFCVFRG